MKTTIDSAGKIKGGSWLLEESDPADCFTPERMSDEHRLIAATTDEFVEGEVVPNIPRLESKDWAFARTLIQRSGKLGLLGVDVPERFGGLNLDKISSFIVSERIARSASFGATFGAQANLCILPIVLFGNESQQAQYLPKLVTGEYVGAYALSEAGSGSDALSARTKAKKQSDGSWRLSGEKMWLTNGGFADVIIVFAQADGDQFTAFIVERAFGGVSSGAEEHKMGLHGSSTTPLVLQDVKVPAGNVLGEIGKGHKVALNTLNFGRFKLGAMCSGGCRNAIGEAAAYAKQRHQFGEAIASFGAIRHKLGEMTARTYAVESLLYRTAGLIEASLRGEAASADAAVRAFDEFAVEASIAKVAGSEALDFVLDENVQIHGGNGYVRDYNAERYYRDARVNRIFEGTNEINRLLIPGMLVRRALKGQIGLIAAAQRLQEDLLSGASAVPSESGDGLAAETALVFAFKRVALIVLGTAMQTFGQKLADEQELLMAAADILIDTFASESAVLRARTASLNRHAQAAIHEAAARVFVHTAAPRIESAAKEALASMADGDTLRTLLAALRRVLKATPTNTIALRRMLADAVVERGRYSLS